MIHNLRMTNFRRHTDTELEFGDATQLLAITGNNGTGKSTIVEAVQYALFGESRHGRRHLARMVRRGAEFSGMEVSMTFSVGKVTYRVVRRYDSGKSTATLYVDENPVEESPDAVTRYISRVTSLDSTGFRAAVTATQGDVEGIAELPAAQRRKLISRLLRHDAINVAAGKARDEGNRETSIWRAMSSGQDPDELHRDVEAAQSAEKEAVESVRDAEQAIADIDRQLTATFDVDSRWQEAQLALARAEATAAAADDEVARSRADLAALHVPDEVPKPGRPAGDVAELISDARANLARAEAAAGLRKAADTTKASIEACEGQLAAVAIKVGDATPATASSDVTRAATRIDDTEQQLQAIEARLETSREEHTTLSVKIGGLDERTRRAGELGDVCDTCEQKISDEHKHTQQDQRDAERARLAEQLEAVTANGKTLAGQASGMKGELAKLRGVRDAALKHQNMVVSEFRSRKEIAARMKSLQVQLAEMPDSGPVDDVDALKSEVAKLQSEKSDATKAELALATRRDALQRLADLEALVGRAEERAKVGRAQVDKARPGNELTVAYEHRKEILETRAAEQELLSEVSKEAALAGERIRSAERAVKDAQARRDEAQEHRRRADIASKSSEALTRTAKAMAQQAAPALETELAQVLAHMSEGRFSNVRVSDDYEITVEDDGEFQPLQEFSGGQRVMIALATRLALANIVGERQGGGGLGFLILDEVFGSQDEERREAILSSLRSMRAMYGQVFLISHVGNFEDVADQVLDVQEQFDDDENRTCQVIPV